MKWSEKHTKLLLSIIAVLLPALGFTTFTAVEQEKELREYRTVVEVIPIEITNPHQITPYDDSQVVKNKEDITELKQQLKELTRWQ